MEGVYRNNLKTIKLFFTKRHPDAYRVYNLCAVCALSVLLCCAVGVRSLQFVMVHANRSVITTRQCSKGT
jgi:hypothetical protein